MSTVEFETSPEGLFDTDFKRSLLRSIALFRDVDPDQITDLLSQCERTDIDEGEVLLSPERKNECVYIVLSGSLTVHLGRRDAPVIARLVSGSCAGEMSLIEDRDPSAFVVANEDSHLMVISHDLLWHMVDRSHQFSKNLLVVLSERVRSDNAYIASSLGVLHEAKQNAVTDALTGLGNRHWMDDVFNREICRSRRGDVQTCLMMIDVDQFKHFNDAYGHIAGDRVLAAVAKALREHLRPTDLIGRFGGDEFAVLLPNTDLEQALATAERLRAAVRELAQPRLTTPITVSIGIELSRSGDVLHELVHRADSAMYRAKSQGRDQVCAPIAL